MAIMRPFLDQLPERGALLPSHAPKLIEQLVPKLNGGFHMGHPCY